MSEILLRDLIEEGARKAGSLTKLGERLDMSQPHISRAKAHKMRLDDEAVVTLADYLGIDVRIVIAANRLALELKEEKRAFWRPFVEHARAATIVLALTLVTSFVTPNQAEASPPLKSSDGTICIM